MTTDLLRYKYLCLAFKVEKYEIFEYDEHLLHVFITIVYI